MNEIGKKPDDLKTLKEIEEMFNPKYKYKNFWEDKKYSIIRFFKEIQYFFIDLYYGIQNIFTYFSIIWKDRDWDYIFMLDLLSFKLKKMQRCIKKYSCAVDSDKDVENIQKVLDLIKIYNDIDNFAFYNDEIDKIENSEIEDKEYWIHRYYQAIYDLEEATYEGIFYYLSKYSRSWWY